MKLKSLLKGFDVESINGDLNIEIDEIVNDTRVMKEKKNYLYVAINGIDEDGHDYLQSAKDNGAVCVVVSKDIDIDFDVIIKVEDSRKLQAHMALIIYDNPTSKLNLVGITATKGKTTTSKMVEAILDFSKKKSCVFGTIGVKINDKVYKSNNTTPDSLTLQKLFKQAVDESCEIGVMEVSSIASKQNRIFGCEYDIAVFGNISKSHIGVREHPTFEDYRESKAKLFKMCKKGIFNIDNEHAQYFIDYATCEVITMSLINKNADIYCENINQEGDISTFTYVGLNEKFEISITLPGKFNIENAIFAISICILLNIPKENIIKGILNTKVKGRCEKVEIGADYTLMIDYAHNSISLLKLLSAMQEQIKKRVIVVFGCGGDRDNTMRYEMGEIAGEHADFTVITSDNPRTEEPKNIVDMIEVGMKRTNGKYKCIVDRTKAIEYAMSIAKKGDLVILAGKGHETYIERNHVKTHYDEREVINEIISKRNL